jgi:hypothetical protein
MLVYCKDNLTKVKISATYEDQDEKDAEEEFVTDNN